MELKDWLNSINHTKENLMEDLSNKKDYPPYIINRCMSAHVDCILYANEMNMHSHLSKDMQYAFYLNGIRKKKRFSPWIRKDKVNDIDAVKQYYGYSNEKASQALKVLNNTQLNFIKQRLEKGGQNGRSNC